tara:strand:+ start:1268 stop:1393 length:126 start_codon:yes stop_codon:yes gene_type:complete
MKKAKYKKAPKGYHRMSSGKLMKGTKHGSKKKKTSKKKRGY